MKFIQCNAHCNCVILVSLPTDKVTPLMVCCSSMAGEQPLVNIAKLLLSAGASITVHDRLVPKKGVTQGKKLFGRKKDPYMGIV